MVPVMRKLSLVALVALAVGCYHWKTDPDIYRIDCNVPHADVFVYDDDGDLMGTYKAGEFFPELDDDGHVEVRADGYYAYSGPVSQLRIEGKKSWFVELKKRRPGDEEPK
jgi:hypothetical protein